MKKISAIIIAVLFIFSGLYAKTDISKKPEPFAEKEFKFPKFETKTLSNGLKVFLIQDKKQPYISLSLLIAGGYSMDGDKPGIAEMTSEMLNKGADTLNALTIAQKLDGMGSSISVSASADFISLDAFTLKKHFPKILDLYSKILLKPTFPQDEFEQAVSQRLSAMESDKSNGQMLASRLSTMVVYGANHPYARRANQKSIKTITIDDLKAYYSKYFVPGNATLAITGDFNNNDIISQVEKYISGWKQTAPVQISIPEPSPLPSGYYFVERPGSVQSSISMSTRGVPLKDENYEALDIAASVIGEGFSGRLFRILREKLSYTYSPYGGLTSNKYNNRFFASAEVRNAVTDSSIIVMRQLIDSLNYYPPTAEELNRVKKLVVGTYKMQFESAGFTSDLIQLADFNGIPIKTIENYPARIMSLTDIEIMNSARKYMNLSNGAIVVVGAPAVREKMQQFGKFYEYNLDLEPVTGEGARFEKVSYDANGLINRYIDAIGGKSALEKIKSLESAGKVNFSVSGQNLPGTFSRKQKSPGMMYLMLDLGVQKSEIWAKEGIVWIGSPAGIQEAVDDMKQDLLMETEIFPIMKITDYGYQCTVLGKQGDFVVMKAENQNGKIKTFYFDKETFLLTKREDMDPTPQGPQLTTSLFENYQPVEMTGVKLPKIMKNILPDFSIDYTMEYKVNQEFDPVIFAPTSGKN